MSEWDDIVEKRILEAMEAGAFDDLAGKGQPLCLDVNPFEGGAWAAHHLLRANGYTLPWIDERKGIEADVEAARAALTRSYRWAQGGLARQPTDPHVEAEWSRAVRAFREQVSKLNRRIRDYNLKVPDAAFQHPPLDVEREIRRVGREAT